MADFPQPPIRSEVVKDTEETLKHNYFTPNWVKWFLEITQLFSRGYTGTITTAAITGGGAQGSMTFVNGVLVDQTPAT